MTLTLILMRHAKSAWDDPSLEDFDRPLNDRGRASATAIGKWLSDHGIAPALALTSGAKRTLETWDGVAAELTHAPKMEVERALYLSSPDTIKAQMSTRTVSPLMVICHNPGIAAFAERITTTPPDHPRFADYPTAATAIIDFEAESWSDVAWFSGHVRAFTVPRDLID